MAADELDVRLADGADAAARTRRSGPTRASPRAACRCSTPRAGAAGRARTCGRCSSPRPPPGGGSTPEPVAVDGRGARRRRLRQRLAYGDAGRATWTSTCRPAPVDAPPVGRAGSSGTSAAAARPARQGRRPAPVHRRTCGCPASSYGRVVRPPSPGAPAARRERTGGAGRGCVRSCADGSFLGVVGADEAAVRPGGRPAPGGRDLGGAPDAARRGRPRRLPARRPARGRRRCSPTERGPVGRRGATAARVVQQAVPGARLDRAELRRRALGRTTGRCRCGATARGSTGCATRSPRRWSSTAARVAVEHDAERRLLRPQRAPTTRPSTRCCSPARCRAGRCRCSGAAATSWPGGRSARRWPPTSRPGVDDDGPDP